MQGFCLKEVFASEGQAGVAMCIKGCVSPVRVFESISALDCHSGPHPAEVTQLLASVPQTLSLDRATLSQASRTTGDVPIFGLQKQTV